MGILFGFYIRWVTNPNFSNLKKLMALDLMNTVDIIEIMENYIARVRPPKEIRQQLDISYRVNNQSIILHEIRPDWKDKTIYRTHDYAKTSYDKKNKVWKIYWQRASLKWELYDPEPAVAALKDFLKEVDQDKSGCFRG
jgi:hypothetical protein